MGWTSTPEPLPQLAFGAPGELQSGKKPTRKQKQPSFWFYVPEMAALRQANRPASHCYPNLYQDDPVKVPVNRTSRTTIELERPARPAPIALVLMKRGPWQERSGVLPPSPLRCRPPGDYRLVRPSRGELAAAAAAAPLNNFDPGGSVGSVNQPSAGGGSPIATLRGHVPVGQRPAFHWAWPGAIISRPG